MFFLLFFSFLKKWVPEIRISGLLSWKNRGNCPRFYFFEKYFFRKRKDRKKTGNEALAVIPGVWDHRYSVGFKRG